MTFWSVLLAYALTPLFSINVLAQTISVVPKFVEGERIHLVIESSRQDARNDHSAQTPVTLTVLSSTSAGSVIVWEGGATKVSNAPPQSAAMLELASDILKGLSLECEFNESGQFVRLRNEEAVLQKMTAAIDAIIQTLVAKAATPEEGANIRAALSQVMQPEIILASTTKHVQLFAGIAGVEVDRGSPLTVELESASPLGTAVHSIITITTRDFDEAGNSVVMDVLSEPTPDSIKEMTRALLRRTLQTEEAGKLEEAMKDFVLEMRDETEYALDLNRGWPTSIHFVRVMNIADQQRKDETRITLESVETP